MDRQLLRGDNGPAFIHRFANHVHDAAQRFRADRNHDRAARIRHPMTPCEAFGSIHGDGAHGRFTEMLGNLEHERAVVPFAMKRV